MKVLHVIPSVAAIRGGASQAAVDMVAALRVLGVDAEIACTNDNGPDLLDVPLGKRVEYRKVPTRFFSRYSPSIKSIREFAYSNDFRQWLKQHIADYDLLHVHGLFSFCSTYAMRLACQRRMPYIAHPIGHLEAWSLAQGQLKKSVYLRLFERANLANASRVHFTAESESRQALGIVPELQPLVIPLGLDLPSLADDAKKQLCDKWGIKQDIPVIAFVARLHPKKGLETLLEALASLQNQRFQLLVAGDGERDYVDSIKAYLNNLGLESNCRLIGFIDGPDKSLLLQGADLFALTSYSENFGIAVLEALAHGTAALVTEGVALSQPVGSHQLGFVTPHSVQAISSALQVALSAPQMIAEMGVNARAYVEQCHHWPELAKQLETGYLDILLEQSGI
ncbi:MAG: glycosyltransferase [Gammaproteobacteria bacterium]|nr:glycosyltransferase [Gammaproteobacteria bacterium]